MGAINIARIVELVEQAEEVALENTAAWIVKDARARAPVRKVFKEPKGFRRKFRELTDAERNLAIKRATAYQGYTDFQRRRSVSYLKNYARAEVPRRGSNNALVKSRQLRVLGIQRGRTFTARIDAVKVVSRQRGRVGFESQALNPLLTSRGRYEVRSGRAIHREVLSTGSVRVHIGGKLKASIESEGVVQTGEGQSVRVTAGIRYAKFVEFPTTHNAAQPFLLPALHDNRERFRRELANEIKRRLGG